MELLSILDLESVLRKRKEDFTRYRGMCTTEEFYRALFSSVNFKSAFRSVTELTVPDGWVEAAFIRLFVDSSTNPIDNEQYLSMERSLRSVDTLASIMSHHTVVDYICRSYDIVVHSDDIRVYLLNNVIRPKCIKSCIRTMNVSLADIAIVDASMKLQISDIKVSGIGEVVELSIDGVLHHLLKYLLLNGATFRYRYGSNFPVDSGFVWSKPAGSGRATIVTVKCDIGSNGAPMLSSYLGGRLMSYGTLFNSMEKKRTYLQALVTVLSTCMNYKGYTGVPLNDIVLSWKYRDSTNISLDITV